MVGKVGSEQALCLLLVWCQISRWWMRLLGSIVVVCRSRQLPMVKEE